MIFLLRNECSLFARILKLTLAAVFATALAACDQSESQRLQQLNTTAESATQPAGSLQVQDSQKQRAGSISSATENPVSMASFQPAAAAAKVIFELPEWEKTPAEIDAGVEAAIASANRQLDAIAGLTPEQSNFVNTIAALDDAFYAVLNISDRIDVIRESHQDAAMREKALQASKRIQAWYVAAGFREDVYKTVAAYAETKPQLQGEDAMLLKDTLRDYRRNGMALTAEKRAQLQALKTELNNMGLEFATNITKAKATI